MHREDVDEAIRRCRACRDENQDCPHLVHEMNDRIDLYATLRDSIPPQEAHDEPAR